MFGTDEQFRKEALKRAVDLHKANSNATKYAESSPKTVVETAEVFRMFLADEDQRDGGPASDQGPDPSDGQG